MLSPIPKLFKVLLGMSGHFSAFPAASLGFTFLGFSRSFTAFLCPNFVAVVLYPIVLILSCFYLKNLSYCFTGALEKNKRSYISRFKLPTEVRILCSSKKIV